MTDRELMQMALEMIEPLAGKTAEVEQKIENAKKTLRDRLAQPEREWVGLTEDEKQFFKAMGFSGIDIVEAKLKEKNT
jgi:uncharacterized protein YukE